MDIEGIVFQNYTNPLHPTAFASLSRLRSFYKPRDISLAGLRHILTKIESYTQKKRPSKVMLHSPTFSWKKREHLQCDLIDLGMLKHDNRNVTFLLTIIDIFTRKAWVYGLRHKTAVETVNAFKKFLAEEHLELGHREKNEPLILSHDAGREFMSGLFQACLRENHIESRVPQTSLHCGFIERFNLSFKRILFSYLKSKSDNHYLQDLPDLVHIYNSRVHRMIKMSPNEAEKDINQAQLLSTALRRQGKLSLKRANIERVWKKRGLKYFLEEGDMVRVAKSIQDDPFHKGYKDTFSDDIFMVKKVHRTGFIPLYTLSHGPGEKEGKELDRKKYREQLQLVSPDRHMVSFPPHKISRRRTRKIAHDPPLMGKNKPSFVNRPEVFISWTSFPSGDYDAWMDRKMYLDRTVTRKTRSQTS